MRRQQTTVVDVQQVIPLFSHLLFLPCILFLLSILSYPTTFHSHPLDYRTFHHQRLRKKKRNKKPFHLGESEGVMTTNMDHDRQL